MAAGIEEKFDATFATRLALREKQIQQNYRPVIGVHKWFARRPGSIFRSLLLAEFNGQEPLSTSYWRSHRLSGVIADPFMGGGTPLLEANRLGFHVIGTDVNPMAFWVVRQSLGELDVDAFEAVAADVIKDVEREVGSFYATTCLGCGETATVKYFLWVKVASCSECGAENDLFPGFLLASDARHPAHVLVCRHCGELNEFEKPPTRSRPLPCSTCSKPIHVEGFVSRQRMECQTCEATVSVAAGVAQAPRHRLWAIEYHCAQCKPRQVGRFFKKPDDQDLARFETAAQHLHRARDLPIPEDEIPDGDETARLHRWGYRRYREMFNERQLYGLGKLLRRLMEVPERPEREALLTVFSDFLRYQNMLCRYDTYALKCQDIFSVHGFPVGLIQCENNLLGIRRVGSGSFRHFVEKYRRAKDYCAQPFETDRTGSRKKLVAIAGESIGATFVKEFPNGAHRRAWLSVLSAEELDLPTGSLDGVFTDPPYFDNVQYAELIDFCFVWLRLALGVQHPEFRPKTTRCNEELTGNTTAGRNLEHFTAGLSDVFCTYASALKPDAPFVFTYHHNDAAAYVPIVVAILDAGLTCTASLPAAAEMAASLHINGTGSSVLDSVFVCRPRSRKRTPARGTSGAPRLGALEDALRYDAASMQTAGLRLTAGDLRCLAAGHSARLAIAELGPSWRSRGSTAARMARAKRVLEEVSARFAAETVITDVLQSNGNGKHAAAV